MIETPIKALVADIDGTLVISNFAHAATCVIGDTPYDINAANTAGIRIVAVRCGGWDERSLLRAFAVYGEPANALDHLPEWTSLHAFQGSRQV